MFRLSIGKGSSRVAGSLERLALLFAMSCRGHSTLLGSNNRSLFSFTILKVWSLGNTLVKFQMQIRIFVGVADCKLKRRAGRKQSAPLGRELFDRFTKNFCFKIYWNDTLERLAPKTNPKQQWELQHCVVAIRSREHIFFYFENYGNRCCFSSSLHL